ncbi:MAG: outer membrane beta-barrel protein, partial [Deltaproteobacteria bacterium]|nr:outer membrane beta-barrel protein [Deltaproteobacteria bacterium]
MRAKKNICLLLGSLGSLLLMTVSAVAQEPTRLMGGIPTSRTRLGLNLVSMPLGSFSTEFGAVTGSVDATSAFGIRPFFDYLLTPYFFIGFGPTYAFNVKPKNFPGDAGTQLDLSLRLGGNAPISDTVQLYGYLSPGYSIITRDGGSDSTGFALGVNAGAMYTLSSTIFLNGELGYQIGYQTTTFGGADVD